MPIPMKVYSTNLGTRRNPELLTRIDSPKSRAEGDIVLFRLVHPYHAHDSRPFHELHAPAEEDTGSA